MAITPAAILAASRGDIGNFMAAITPGGIERQEAQGQQDMVNAAVLPRELSGPIPDGVILSDVVDDLFQKVTLPRGWIVKPTDHSMWSDLIDDAGAKRASIFYKAAFYDRRAFARFEEVSK